MTRVKRGVTTKRRHKKVLKMAKGFRTVRHKLYRRAVEAVLRAGDDAFRDRKKKKRDYRRLWITRINIVLKDMKFPYKTFIHNLTEKNIKIDRKILAKLAVEQPETFKQIVEEVRSV